MGELARLRCRAKDYIAARHDPVAFAKSLGVNVKGRVTFYGVSRAMFGSEPWMITLGDKVFITAGVQFITHDGGTLILRDDFPDLEWSAPIKIGDYVYVGLNALILPGVEIGNRVVVGAGSVVTKSVPENSVVAGNPARMIRTLDEYTERMRAKSLGVGHLRGLEKDAALRRMFGYPAGTEPG